jgi:hypothetical protein
LQRRHRFSVRGFAFAEQRCFYYARQIKLEKAELYAEKDSRSEKEEQRGRPPDYVFVQEVYKINQSITPVRFFILYEGGGGNRISVDFEAGLWYTLGNLYLRGEYYEEIYVFIACIGYAVNSCGLR